MTGKKYLAVMTGFVLSVSLTAACLTALLMADFGSRMHMKVLGGICQRIIEARPEAEQAVMSALKEYEWKQDVPQEEDLLLSYGYGKDSFWHSAARHGKQCAAVGSVAGSGLFLAAFWFRNKKETTRIKNLTRYLEKVNTGRGGILVQDGEDEFSKLQDEIYKTVTMLYQTADAAVLAKQNFAENLSNIAHQMKTPLTSASLSVQMCQKEHSLAYLDQVRQQLSRLMHLEESLLLLSRIDSGALPFEKKETDVFTLLTLAADNLQELLQKADVSVEIPESGEMLIDADLEWTMEAVMNLMKNCLEHTPQGGTVSCSYEQNPIYTKIQIQDTGPGFAKKDIPHLFERFYRGEGAGSEGIGIGLAIAKAIIENQNGTVHARNLEDSGACFEICFYSH